MGRFLVSAIGAVPVRVRASCLMSSISPRLLDGFQRFRPLQSAERFTLDCIPHAQVFG